MSKEHRNAIDLSYGYVIAYENEPGDLVGHLSSC